MMALELYSSKASQKYFFYAKRIFRFYENNARAPHFCHTIRIIMERRAYMNIRTIYSILHGSIIICSLLAHKVKVDTAKGKEPAIPWYTLPILDGAFLGLFINDTVQLFMLLLD